MSQQSNTEWQGVVVKTVCCVVGGISSARATSFDPFALPPTLTGSRQRETKRHTRFFLGNSAGRWSQRRRLSSRLRSRVHHQPKTGASASRARQSETTKLVRHGF